jgi:hypothetical protein
MKNASPGVNEGAGNFVLFRANKIAPVVVIVTARAK